jgi:hypothetical protein
VALDTQATVPRYRTAFSKHQFSQPQLLAILCFMRYEDWTYRLFASEPAPRRAERPLFDLLPEAND